MVASTGIIFRFLLSCFFTSSLFLILFSTFHLQIIDVILKGRDNGKLKLFNFGSQDTVNLRSVTDTSFNLCQQK